jgi:hypothetical protein
MPSDHPPRDSSASSTREGWLRDFALLLRLRGLDGARIGGALIAWFGAGFVLMVALPLALPQALATVHPVVALVLGVVFVALGIMAVRQIPATRSSIRGAEVLSRPRRRHGVSPWSGWLEGRGNVLIDSRAGNSGPGRWHPFRGARRDE